MSAMTTSFPNTAAGWHLPSRGKVAMAGLIIAESAIFTIFVVAYLFYLGKSLTGPTPREVLETPIFFTICLLSSSLTIHFAREVVGAGLRAIVPRLVAADHCAGWLVSLWHGAGMAPTDLRTRPDDLDQLVWDNLLLTRRLACISRHRRSDHALGDRDVRICWPYGSEPVRSRRSALDVLAFRRCRLGCGFHGSLRSWTLRSIWQHYRRAEELNESPRAPREIEVPAPTAWPFILALGAALLFAGLVTSASVSVSGRLLSLAGCVGWFREVFPREHEEVVPVLPEDIRSRHRRAVERFPSFQIRCERGFRFTPIRYQPE